MKNEKLSEQIENNFIHYTPTPEKLEGFQAIRTYAKDLAETINELCPDSREKSLAITNLEEAMFWANAAIARY